MLSTMNLILLVFMCEITPRRFIKEFERFSNIVPRLDAYFCKYIKKQMLEMAPLIQDFINFIEQNSKFKCFYLNKYEFVDFNNSGEPFFNKRKLEEKVEEICSGNKNATPEKKRWLLRDLHVKFIDKDKEGFSTVTIFIDYLKPNFLIIIDRNIVSFSCRQIMFYEFCRCLQRVYDNKLKKQILKFSKKSDQTQSIASKEYFGKKIFLNQYILDTQTSLFSYMGALLYDLGDKDFNKLENTILFQSRFKNHYGVNEYPLLLDEIKNIRENPQQYQEFFADKTISLGANDSQTTSTVKILDYKKLYDYTMKKVLGNPKETMLKASSLDQKTTRGLFRIAKLEIPEALSFHFALFIDYIELCIAKKELSLKKCKYELRTIKTNLPQKYSERLDGAFNTLVDNLQKNGVKICQ